MKENKKKESEPAIQNKADALFDKAKKMTAVYTQATGCGICIYDHNYMPLTDVLKESEVEKSICLHCIKYQNEPAGAEPCRDIHVSAIKEAGSQGGSRIYKCDLGFLFWTSPIYNEGSFSGALRGTGFLSEEQQNTDEIAGMCKGTIPAEEFTQRVANFPKGDTEKIQSLAEMLLLCAESLSSGSEDYHEILRRRAEQQRVLSEMIEGLKIKYPEGSVLPGYPLDKERLLIAALHRGDSAAALHILNEVLALLIFANPKHFRYIQLRAIELVVLLSRVGINPGHSGTSTLETNNRCLKQVQEAKTIEELTDILHAIVKRISGQITSFQGIRHGTALRKAEHFIRENYTQKISLGEIAKISGLSAPYFSTIFKEEMGENLSKYLNRLRVERASHLLLETDLSLSEIAGACCFEDQSWFSKIFKAYTGISPGKYRSQGGGMVREISENNLSEDFLKTIK
jgi:AraC-like DNA-binding protein/ligand-binding sensor protein